MPRCAPLLAVGRAARHPLGMALLTIALLTGASPLRAQTAGTASPSPVPRAPVTESPAARACVDAAGTGVAGATLIADARTGALVAGHAERGDRPLIPASTFKIISALVALETGVIAEAQTVIPWDSVTRDRPEINRDLDLQTAFRLSAVPHFQSLVRRIGPTRMQHALDTIGYGNRDIRGGIDQFWLTGALRISPREQVALLTRLLHDDLPVSRRSMAIVRAMMLNEATAAYTIRAKTGLATPPGSETVGWWVGWVEHGAAVHVFATVLETAAPTAGFNAQRLAVTRCALQALSILPVAP
jgi:beta-lactamase class D